MEVWLVNHYALTPDRPGGTRHFDLGTELTKHGLKVKVFACDINLATRKRTSLDPNELYRVEKRGDLEFVWVNAVEYEQNNWKRIHNMASFATNFKKVARMLGGPKPDVIVGSSPHPFTGMAALKLSKEFNCRFWLELRDLWPQALIDMGGMTEGSYQARGMRYMEKKLYAAAERFIILAEGSAGYLTKRGVDPRKILYIPNGVHLDHFKPTRSREESRAKFDFERFTVVYAGAHGPANALHTILNASTQTGDGVEFVLVGDGPSKLALVEQAKTEKLKNVRFLDPIPKDEIPNFLTAADAGVITLQNIEAFAYAVSPNKLFDYMGASLPVLAATPGDMARMVETARAGLVVEPENPADLAAKTLEMAALSADERLDMGARGRAYVSENFSRIALAAKLAAELKA